MDIQSMLPLLMMMNGNKGGKSTGGMPDMSALLQMMGGGKPAQKSGGGMPDIGTLMQMMSLMNNGNLGNATKTQSNPNKGSDGTPLEPDLSGIGGMISPELIELLRSLARRE